MIVTIDGPAGAGKSTAAKLLAQRLGFRYLDTGAMFRAVALAGLKAGLELTDETALAGLLDDLVVELPPGKVFLNGADVTDAIRTSAVTAASAPVASSPVVRNRLKDWQQAIAATGDIVCEGRDQGTKVFPNAECKFFLIARPEERALRRHRQLRERGEQVTYEEILHAQLARDERDAARDIAPMVPADDAILLDSTDLSLEEVVERMRSEVERRKVS